MEKNIRGITNGMGASTRQKCAGLSATYGCGGDHLLNLYEPRLEFMGPPLESHIA